jgi:large subunit ribosomal protein LP0
LYRYPLSKCADILHQIKDYLENPDAFAVAAPTATESAAPAAAAAVEEKEEEKEEESDEDMGFGLFD